VKEEREDQVTERSEEEERREPRLQPGELDRAERQEEQHRPAPLLLDAGVDVGQALEERGRERRPRQRCASQATCGDEVEERPRV
jgi:hypothetical protein